MSSRMRRSGKASGSRTRAPARIRRYSSSVRTSARILRTHGRASSRRSARFPSGTMLFQGKLPNATSRRMVVWSRLMGITSLARTAMRSPCMRYSWWTSRGPCLMAIRHRRPRHGDTPTETGLGAHSKLCKALWRGAEAVARGTYFHSSRLIIRHALAQQMSRSETSMRIAGGCSSSSLMEGPVSKMPSKLCLRMCVGLPALRCALS
mmetsp:Transcript_121577/g.259524  ORF Transcript_121577/g.259524 Transcript_121577/m.259524 type:complete len:207 (-) Transcript_121577:388-1008(-)